MSRGGYDAEECDSSKGKRNPSAKQLTQSVTMRIDRTTLAYCKGLASELDVPYQTPKYLYLRECAMLGRRGAMTWRPSRARRCAQAR